MLIGVLAMSSASGRVSGEEALRKFTYERPKLGTILRISVYCREETLANEAAKAAFTRANELNGILSDYEPDSELNRLCRESGPGKPIHVSQTLFDVLRDGLAISEATDGAFDVTVGPLTKLWRKARRRKQLPDDEELAAARERVGWKHVVLDEFARTVELKKPGMQLDLGGIAKGYIAEEMRAVLRDKGIDRALVDAGGDLAVGEAPPGRKGWRIVVESPGDGASSDPEGTERSAPRVIEVSYCGIATSGDLYQFLEIDGKRYSHIVDPRTGLGLTRRSNVTVVALVGSTADAWASAISVLGPERGLELVEDAGFVEALVRFTDGDVVRTVETPGFGKRTRPCGSKEGTPR